MTEERVSVRHGQLVWSRDWTAAELAEAKRLRQGGVSASAIGRKLKRTRNSVIGALHRAEEPRVLANQHLPWGFTAPPSRLIPLRFSEQRRVP